MLAETPPRQFRVRGGAPASERYIGTVGYDSLAIICFERSVRPRISYAGGEMVITKLPTRSIAKSNILIA